MKKRSRVKRFARFVLRGGRRRVGAAGALKKSPRYLLFDFDGTLGDTFLLGFEILNILSAEFGFRSLPREELEFARDLSTSGLMKHLGISRMKLHKISQRGTEEIGKRIDSVQTFAGVPEMVHHLHAAGFRLGILTSNSEPNVRAFLKNQNLELFDFIESSSKLLGKGSVLRRLMKERHLKPREILLIGDELRDIEAAQETGVHMAAVTWGYNSRAALEAAVPDYLFETPAQVLEFLAGWTPEKATR
jgi:HAD superfamily hydrolase (TIGR01549 family)